jgi:hypothetical protein
MLGGNIDGNSIAVPGARCAVLAMPRHTKALAGETRKISKRAGSAWSFVLTAMSFSATPLIFVTEILCLVFFGNQSLRQRSRELRLPATAADLFKEGGIAGTSRSKLRAGGLAGSASG